MNIKYNNYNGILLIKLGGDIDHITVSKFRSNIKMAVNKYKSYKIILDLSEVYFMDSSGIGMLIGRYKELSLHSGEIVLTGINKNIDKILSLSGLYKVFKYFDSINDAIKYYEEGMM